MSDKWATHSIEFNGNCVIKRFRRCGRGEHEREWRALTLLAEYAPGLAPTPLDADLTADTPVVMMSRLGGSPLRGQEVGRVQIKAMAETIAVMHTAVPPDVLVRLPVRSNESATIAQIHRLDQQHRVLDRTPIVAQAVDEGLRWLSHSDIGDPNTDAQRVFGLRDGNLANYLWTGSHVQVVDFEDSGPSDRVFELADISEHVSSWVDTVFDVPFFLEQFDLTDKEAERFQQCRRLLALMWLLLLENSTNPTNPPGTAERQANRLLNLLE